MQIVLFQTIQFSMSTQFNCQKHFYFKLFYKYTVSSIQPTDRALSGATIPGQSGPGSNGNEGVLLLYSCDTTIRIHIHAETKSTIMTNEHTSLEKYTSHTLFEWVVKGLCVRGELETEQTATYWPQVPLSLAALLSHSAGLPNRGSWGPKPSAGSWFSLPRTPTNWLQLWHQVI